MLVSLKDGQCRSCKGQIKITDADDATMTVECQDPACSDSYLVEVDAFGDGAMHYYPHVMATLMEGGDLEDVD